VRSLVWTKVGSNQSFSAVVWWHFSDFQIPVFSAELQAGWQDELDMQLYEFFSWHSFCIDTCVTVAVGTYDLAGASEERSFSGLHGVSWGHIHGISSDSTQEI